MLIPGSSPHSLTLSWQMTSEMAGRIWNPLENGLLRMLMGDYLDCVEVGTHP